MTKDELMTEEQIKFILESVNFYEKNKNVIYTRNDIKNDNPTKPISCYVITANYSNPNLPHVYYGGYDGNKFLSCHVSSQCIIPCEEYNVLGYIEYK
jgi:hypothetical protein